MTREEAIDCLEGLKIYLKTEHIDQEAVDMAIDALTYQNLSKPNKICEVDLISREDAIKVFIDWGMKEFGFHDFNRNERFIDALSALPSAKAKWIPCSERLPEEFDVLCCDNHGNILVANPFKCDESDTGFSAESDECYMYNCIAWMPRPKPYREESEVE